MTLKLDTLYYLDSYLYMEAPIYVLDYYLYIGGSYLYIGLLFTNQRLLFIYCTPTYKSEAHTY